MAATQWLFNFVVARAVPSMLVTVGNQGFGTYFIFGSFCFCMFVFVWFFIPETKGLSLERMDDLFGVTEALAKNVEEGDNMSRSIEGSKNSNEIREERA